MAREITPWSRGSRLNIGKIDGAYTVLQSDSSKVFMVEDNSGGTAYTITLPTTLVEGTYYKFVIRQSGTLANTVTIDAGSAIIDFVMQDAGGSNTDSSNTTAGTAKQYIKFKTSALQGDYAQIFTDGTTWYGECMSGVDNAINHT